MIVSASFLLAGFHLNRVSNLASDALIPSRVATSNAPATRRKRRLSSTERDHDAEEDEQRKKKQRGESTTSVDEVPTQTEAEAEVKEVTQGVKEVELEDKPTESPQALLTPESIPLPNEESGEFDESASEASESSSSPEAIASADVKKTVISVANEETEGKDKAKPTTSVESDEDVEEEESTIEDGNTQEITTKLPSPSKPARGADTPKQ